MSNLFSKVLRPTRDESSVGKVVSAIKDQLNTSAGVVQRTSISGILAMESVTIPSVKNSRPPLNISKTASSVSLRPWVWKASLARNATLLP